MVDRDQKELLLTQLRSAENTVLMAELQVKKYRTALEIINRVRMGMLKKDAESKCEKKIKVIVAPKEKLAPLAYVKMNADIMEVVLIPVIGTIFQ